MRKFGGPATAVRQPEQMAAWSDDGSKASIRRRRIDPMSGDFTRDEEGPGQHITGLRSHDPRRDGSASGKNIESINVLRWARAFEQRSIATAALVVRKWPTERPPVPSSQGVDFQPQFFVDVSKPFWPQYARSFRWHRPASSAGPAGGSPLIWHRRQVRCSHFIWANHGRIRNLIALTA